jgi:hypothetical protein
MSKTAEQAVEQFGLQSEIIPSLLQEPFILTFQQPPLPEKLRLKHVV